MTTIKWIDLKEDIIYNGSQLSHAWVLEKSRDDNVIITFQGPCNIDNKFMVDLEDLRMGCLIRSDRMLHFIIRHNFFSLPFIVFAQRLFVVKMREILQETYQISTRRCGDDLFYEKGKLNISVATASPDNSSGLIHTAVNITNKGTPAEINTASLKDLEIHPEDFKKHVIRAYMDEWNDIVKASGKVKNV